MLSSSELFIETMATENSALTLKKFMITPPLGKNLGKWIVQKLTLIMAQWVDMEALENKNHAFLSWFFDSLGTIRQIS